MMLSRKSCLLQTNVSKPASLTSSHSKNIKAKVFYFMRKNDGKIEEFYTLINLIKYRQDHIACLKVRLYRTQNDSLLAFVQRNSQFRHGV